MHVLSVLFLGISTNLDNLLVGISYGLQKKRIPFLSNAAIGLFSAAATFLFCSLSSLCSTLGKVPNIAGGLIIILLGLYSLFSAPKTAKEEKPPSPCVWKETAALGAALAVNCVPVAFAAGLTGVPSLWASASVGLASILCVGAGNRLGINAAVKIRPKLLNAIGGGMLITLGCLEIFI